MDWSRSGLTRAILVMIPLIFSVGTTNGQAGVFTESGTGVRVGAAEAYARGGSSFDSPRVTDLVWTASAGYVVNRRLELGTEFWRWADGWGKSVTAFGPYVSFYPLREPEERSTSIALEGAFRLASISTPSRSQPANSGGVLDPGMLRTSVRLFRSATLGESVDVILQSSVDYHRFISDIGSRGMGVDINRDRADLSFAVSFQVNESDDSRIYLTPSYSFLLESDIYRNGLGLSIALVFDR